MLRQDAVENSENTENIDLSHQVVKESVKINTEPLNDDEQKHPVTKCFKMTVRNRKQRMIIGNHLSENESQQLQRVVNQYQDCFRTDQSGVCTQF